MAIATDASDLLSIWGSAVTVRRPSTTYGDTGKPTVTWATQASPTGLIQPADGETLREEEGQKVRTTHVLFVANGTDVLEGDRVRPNGWVSGDDEYQVHRVEAWTPSHSRCRLVRTKGHGG